MNGLMTERQWRRQAMRLRKPRPEWWGAQCVLPRNTRPSLKQDKAFWAFLALLSLAVSALLPALAPKQQLVPEMPDTAAALSKKAAPRQVNAITYALPEGLAWQEHTYTRAQLLHGRLMLLDAEHPLPADAPPPNTVNLASAGKGMIPLSGLGIKAGQETAEALGRLFSVLRQKGVTNLSVCMGTQSRAEQGGLQTAFARRLLASQRLSQAVTAAAGALDRPGEGDYQQEYTVCVERSGDRGELLRETAEDGWFYRLAWRYGFICRYPRETGLRAGQLRYVGQAHAMAMTYLDLSLEAYLEWLHQVGTLVISPNSRPQYVILAKPISGTHISFSLPQKAKYEASLDNMGYAIVACELSE